MQGYERRALLGLLELESIAVCEAEAVRGREIKGYGILRRVRRRARRSNLSSASLKGDPKSERFPIDRSDYNI